MYYYFHDDILFLIQQHDPVDVEQRNAIRSSYIETVR